MHETLPYQRVLALINFDGNDEKIARKALMLARLNRAHLLFLHLIEPDAALDGGYPAASAKAEAAALEAGAMRRLDFLKAQLSAGETECIARFGPTRQGLKHLLREWQPDLIVSGLDPGYLTGNQDLLILGQPHRLSGGAFKRISNWLSTQFHPAST
jgi:nucleotide-binding universal stress UspA family protein